MSFCSAALADTAEGPGGEGGGPGADCGPERGAAAGCAGGEEHPSVGAWLSEGRVSQTMHRNSGARRA